MAYVPTNWASGDIVTAEKLNKAENGIVAAGNVMLVHLDYDPGNTDEGPSCSLVEEVQDIIDFFQSATPEESKVVVATPSSAACSTYDVFFSIPIVPVTVPDPETGDDIIVAYVGCGLMFIPWQSTEILRAIQIVIDVSVQPASVDTFISGKIKTMFE